MWASESPFQSYKSKRILSFANLICSSVSGTKALRKKVSAFCPTQLQWKVMEHFRNSIRKMWTVYKNQSHWKNISKEKIRRISFCCWCVNLPTVKIGGQSDKLPMSFSSLQCPLQVKIMFRENSAKHVNPTCNFYFRPKIKTAISLPIFNLFQWLFYFRDLIWIITLSETSKFEENCRSEGVR